MIWMLISLTWSCNSNKGKAYQIDIQELTIAQIHEAFHAGTYNSEQLVEAYLKQIKEYNDQVNAVTYLNPAAIAIARELDAEFAQTGTLRPLHGIPMLVKDNFNTKDLPTTAGSIALQDFYPSEDATMVAQLIEAGAILLGKTNMAEWAFSPMHSESSTFGITRNPYDLSKVPAGSSGGTGAAIAANFAVIGLGTDTGNSIRGPSSHNALVGFRSTLGLTSRAGVVPLYLRNDVAGPMCRTVADATKVLEVIAAIDPLDPLTAFAEGKIQDSYQPYLTSNGLEGKRIGVFQPLLEAPIHDEVRALFEQAKNDLARLGATVVDRVGIPNFEEVSSNQWCRTFREDLGAFLTTYVKNDTISTLEDIIRIGSRSEYTTKRLQTMAATSGRGGAPEIPCGNAYEDTRRVAYRQAIEKVMDSLQLDAFIYPSWNFPPANIEAFSEEYRGDNSQIIAPHTGQPAFTVPMGFVADKWPAGLQFLGRMYDDGVLIQLMYGYEQGTKWRRPPVLSN